jgi:NADH-quinone oxidoreductase subunit A
MTSAAYLPLLIQAVLALGVGITIYVVNHVFAQRVRVKNAIKDTAYECGVKGEGIVHTRFSVKFYVTAMLFLLFDIEIVFLIPWTFVYRDFLANNVAILSPMMFFLFVLVLGLFYEVKKGALSWDK